MTYTEALEFNRRRTHKSFVITVDFVSFLMTAVYYDTFSYNIKNI